ncbi:ribonuclease H-like domain-containing protein [Tanacetum coccineum]
MALLEDHLAKFHKMTDEKEMWEAIKSRFGGNDESKKMQKFQSLLSQLEIHGAGVSTEDANQKFLRVFEPDVKGSSASSSSTLMPRNQLALISPKSSATIVTRHGILLENADLRGIKIVGGEMLDTLGTKLKTVEGDLENRRNLKLCNSGLDTEVNSCSKECKESYAKLKKLYDEQREQLGNASIEIQAYTQALKKVEAQLAAYQQNQLWYEENIRFMKINLDDKTDVLTYHKKLLAKAEKEKEELKAKVEKWHNSSKGLNILLNSQMSARDKAGLGYGNQMHTCVLSYENEVFGSVFDSRSSDIEDSPVNDRYAEGMHVVPPPMIGIYISSGPDIEIDESHEEILESMPEPVVNEPKVVSQPKVGSDAPIIEEYESYSDDEHVSLPTKEPEVPSFDFVNIVKHVKTPRQTVKEQNTCSQNPKPNKKDCSGLMSKKLGLGYGFTKKACFVCGSFSHLIRDCDFHEKRMAKQAELNKRMCKGTDQRENRPVWNNVQRVNHQNQFVPTAVLTRTGRIPVNTARASSTNNVNTARHNFNSQAAPTNAARKVNTVKPIVNNVRPKTIFHKTHSPIRRPFNRTTAPRTKFSNQKVNTAEVKAVSAVGGKRETAVKPSAALKNKWIIDSGCSRHMTRNKAYLAEYQDYNGGHVAFGGSKCYITGKGIKREYSNARTPKQNGVAERKNRTHIEAARTMLADSFLPNTFWAEVVSTACYVLNRPVRSENQANKHAGPKKANHSAGTQDNIHARNSEMEAESAQDYFVLPIWSSYTSIVKSSKVKNEGEKPNKNTNLKTNEKPVGQEDQSFLDELERLKRQEKEANDAAEALRKEFAQDTKDLLLQAGAARASSTNTVNTASIPVSTASPSGRLSYTDLTNTDQDDSQIPALEDIYDNPNDGIFTNTSYDDEGTVADFINLETIVNVSPILTSRIHSIHPSTQILRDPKLAVQTRSKVNKSSGAHAFVSYIQKQRRNNHKDFQHCLFACFLSQIEPKKISKALEDESWVDPMQEELLQFKIQKVWILIDLAYGKKAIGTKWVYRNKTDERGVVVRNKAMLVAQVHRQEEGIDYDEVFALVARIEAIRIFLAFASYMGFIVYQMDMKSTFLYGIIDEEVYVSQPPGFVDPKCPKKVYKVVKALYVLHQALRSCVKIASTPIETQKPLVKDEEATNVDVHLYRSMIGSLIYLTASMPDIMFTVCACSRFQVTPKTSYLNAVKRIFRYLKGKPKLGLWYPRVSSFDLEAYSDSNYAGANLNRKSTTGGCQFLGRRLISWQWKKHTIMATSTIETEYVAAANCYGQVLWIQNQLLDYGFNFMNTKIYIDNESTICIVKNLVFHSKTKHIEIRHHFIRDAYEKKPFQAALVKGRQVDLLYNLYEVFCEQKNLDDGDVFHRVIWVPESNWKELSMSRMVTLLNHDPNTQCDRLLREGLMGNAECHEIMTFLHEVQFTMLSLYITATVAGKPVTISEASIRSDLLFDDADKIDTLNNQAIFDTIQLMGLKNVPVPLDHFPINTLTSKVLSFMVKKGKNFSGNVTPLFDSMLVQSTEDEGEASKRPSESQPIPSPSYPSKDQPESQPDPSPRPSPSIPIPDSNPKGSGGNHGGQSSSDKSLSGNEDGLTLQSVYDLCVSLCKQVTIQAKEIKDLKAQFKKLKKNARPGRKTAKSKPTAHKDQAFDDDFDDLDDLDAMDYMETEDAHNEMGVSTEDQVSTANLDEGTDKPKVSTDQLNGSTDKLTAEPKNVNSDENATPTVFRDDETIVEFLVSMSQNKAKQKGVEIKDAEDSNRPRPTSTRSVLTLKPLPKIDPKDKGKKVIDEEAKSEAESERVNKAERKFAQLANDEEIARKVQEE